MSETRQHIFQKGLLNNKVVIITGGGTGIGRETAFNLGHLGAKIVICGRRLEPLKKTCEELENLKIECFYESCDIRDYEKVSHFVDNVLSKFGRIDILINNAGGQFPSPAINISPNGFKSVVTNNLIGTWNMTHVVAKKSFIPLKIDGTILNVVAQVKRGFPGMSHTGAARAGVINLTKTLAIEWSPYNITINSIAPGVIDPNASGTKKYETKMMQNAINATPLKRLGSVQEISNLMTFMVLPISKFITGQCYYIDGGQSLYGDFYKPSKI
eukprot:gene2829-4236_t